MNESTDVEDADLKMLSLPTALFKHVGSDSSSMFAPLNQDMWDGLERVGYKTISRPEEQELPSLLSLTIQRAGGFYIDVGCSPLISSGAIRVKSSPAISHFTEHFFLKA